MKRKRRYYKGSPIKSLTDIKNIIAVVDELIEEDLDSLHTLATIRGALNKEVRE